MKKNSLMWKYLNAPEDYFKHSDRDPQDILEFDPVITEIFLEDALAYFRLNHVYRPKYYFIFLGWAGKPEESIPKASELYAAMEILRGKLRNLGKKQYWDFSIKYLRSSFR